MILYDWSPIWNLQYTWRGTLAVSHCVVCIHITDGEVRQVWFFVCSYPRKSSEILHFTLLQHRQVPISVNFLSGSLCMDWSWNFFLFQFALPIESVWSYDWLWKHFDIHYVLPVLSSVFILFYLQLVGSTYRLSFFFGARFRFNPCILEHWFLCLRLLFDHYPSNDFFTGMCWSYSFSFWSTGFGTPD